jgi:hypothetical protein
MPVGCPFYDRCKFRTAKCHEENPPLMSVGVKHWSACWNYEAVREQRDAILGRNVEQLAAA